MTVLTQILNQMPRIHQPQRKFLLALFATIACLRGRVNFRNLARYSDYSERTFHRQFRQEFEFAEFNRLAIEQGVALAATLLVAQDATFIPKSGKLTYGLSRGRKRQFDGKVSVASLSRFDFCGEVEPGLELYTAVANSVTLKRNIRIVVLLDRRKADHQRYVVLCSTDCSMAAEMIFSYYAARFQIEFLFRDAKQFTGLSECQARDHKALHFHLNAALAAVNLARIKQLQQSGTATAQVFSLASYKQRAFNEHLLELFISKLALQADLIKNHPQYNYLRNYGAIAA